MSDSSTLQTCQFHLELQTCLTRVVGVEGEGYEWVSRDVRAWIIGGRDVVIMGCRIVQLPLSKPLMLSYQLMGQTCKGLSHFKKQNVTLARGQ
jgi:hypothetical protein